MSWSIGYSSHFSRDIGYGVPAFCDHPKCNQVIDRGLGYVCGGEHGGGDCGQGCGLYFCGEHLRGLGRGQKCPKCARYDHRPYKAKPDHPDWIKHKLTDESWQKWRDRNPDEVKKLSMTYSILPNSLPTHAAP